MKTQRLDLGPEGLYSGGIDITNSNSYLRSLCHSRKTCSSLLREKENLGCLVPSHSLGKKGTQ